MRLTGLSTVKYGPLASPNPGVYPDDAPWPAVVAVAARAKLNLKSRRLYETNGIAQVHTDNWLKAGDRYPKDEMAMLGYWGGDRRNRAGRGGRFVRFDALPIPS